LRTETIRRGNLKAEKKGKRDFVKEYNEKLEQLTVANEQMLEEDLDRKRDMVSLRNIVCGSWVVSDALLGAVNVLIV
jgi:hypothetical protein